MCKILKIVRVVFLLPFTVVFGIFLGLLAGLSYPFLKNEVEKEENGHEAISESQRRIDAHLRWQMWNE